MTGISSKWNLRENLAYPKNFSKKLTTGRWETIWISLNWKERKKEPEIIGYFINSWITSKTKNRELAKIRENITQITDKLTSLDGDGKEGSREIL